MLSKNRNIRVVSLACAVASVPMAGQAASVMFDFKAALDNASFDLIAAAGGLGAITESFTFDDTTCDSQSLAHLVVYDAITTLNFTDTAGNSASASSAEFTIEDGIFGPDRYTVRAPISTSG